MPMMVDPDRIVLGPPSDFEERIWERAAKSIFEQIQSLSHRALEYQQYGSHDAVERFAEEAVLLAQCVGKCAENAGKARPGSHHAEMARLWATRAYDVAKEMAGLVVR